MIRLLLIAAVAAAVPLIPRGSSAPAPPVAWPARFEGRALRAIPPAPIDRIIARDFPGRIARFDDGRRQIVLRSVARATRQVHPAQDCFRAAGYRLTPLPMRRIAGGLASCFEARRPGVTLRVCESIAGADRRVFPDMSSWYWPALLGTARGPWLAATRVERIG